MRAQRQPAAQHEAAREQPNASDHRRVCCPMRKSGSSANGYASKPSSEPAFENAYSAYGERPVARSYQCWSKGAVHASAR